MGGRGTRPWGGGRLEVAHHNDAHRLRLQPSPHLLPPPPHPPPPPQSPAPQNSTAKFLVDKEGNVVTRSAENPLALEGRIEELLAA
jgi:hypothetical protein